MNQDCNYEKLEEENRELKTVMRKLSHEMGNALTLLGASIFYLESDVSREKTSFAIRDLKGDYVYICNLFKQLREYNHPESIEKREIDVQELEQEIESSFNKMAGRENIKLVKHSYIKGRTPKVVGDIVKLRQVIINIIKNAIEAMEKNVNEKKKIIDVKIAKEENMLHIAIRDSGCGIDLENVDEIFQPMFTFGKKHGTGLGLSVVKKIIEEHGGNIKAVSVLGTGTAIHIYLPTI